MNIGAVMMQGVVQNFCFSKKSLLVRLTGVTGNTSRIKARGFKIGSVPKDNTTTRNAIQRVLLDCSSD